MRIAVLSDVHSNVPALDAVLEDIERHGVEAIVCLGDHVSGPIDPAGGLIFISGTQDRKLRAFEKRNGKLVWQTTLPGVANATACTYMSGGKQYVALSVGGTKENPSGSVMAFALP